MLPLNFRLFRNLIPLTVFLVLSLYPHPGSLQDTPVYLSPPGLRSVKDPSIIVPAGHRYLNQPPEKPVYRNASGKLVEGWAMKYVATRRFSSDGSAWIYYRTSDLKDSKTVKSAWGPRPFRIWPADTTIVLESYRGNAVDRNSTSLVEIVVMHKVSRPESALIKSLYSTNWNYARFTPEGELSNIPEKVLECHQCHGIAFRLTGDLIFTQFP
jgi:hypothetical protein